MRFPLPKSPAARVTVTYVAVGALWVLLADQVISRLTNSETVLTWLDTSKGWILVAVTAVLIYAERRKADLKSGQLAAVVAATDDAIIGATPEGIVTDWNPGAEKLYELPAEKAVGRPLAGIVMPGDPAFREMLARVQAGETFRRRESERRGADGREVCISLTTSPIRDAHGEIVGISATARDVTERKRREEALRHQAQIIDQIHDAVVATDLDGNVTSWNRGAELLFGYTAAEMKGRPISSMYPPEEHGHLRDGVIAPLREKGQHETEVRMRRKDGTDFFAHLSLSLVRNEHGLPTGMIGYSLDITDRKRAEMELRMAELGKLASGLVHEIRNPLNAMRMQIAVIHGKLRQPEDGNLDLALQQLSRLETEVLRVTDLATDFLAYGRPGPDKLEDVDVRAVVRDVAEFVRPTFERSGLTVVCSAAREETGELSVRMDRGKLRQVLLNLAENARQAMGESGRLELRVDPATDREVRIIVADDGPGIVPERMARVFEPFYSTREGGTGLGLAIVKRTVENAGGRVQLRSAPDAGCRFEIRLPLVRELHSAPEAAPSP